jgi:hypothetical protein
VAAKIFSPEENEFWATAVIGAEREKCVGDIPLKCTILMEKCVPLM